MQILIRPIQPDDTEEVLGVYRSAIKAVIFDEYGNDILSEWGSRSVEEFERQSQTRRRYVADIGGRIAGYTGLDIRKSQLTECYVSPEFAGRSIGTTLVDMVVKEAQRADLEYLKVFSALNAVPFYRRCGFEDGEFGFLAMEDGLKMRCLWMKKKI